MFNPNLPEHIAFAEVDGLQSEYRLHPDEQKLLSPAASTKRREEFALGRAAANLALQRLGFITPPPILKGARREPLWPPGVVGSLSHGSGRAVAAAALETKLRFIGIDIQEAKIRDYPAVLRHVTTEAERKWLDALEPAQALAALALVFSAKESLYKAFNHLFDRPLRFSDAEIFPGDKLGAMLARLSGRIPEVGAELQVLTWEDGGLVMTLVCVPALR